MRDIADVLPEFDPSNHSNLDSNQFIQRISNLYHAYGWNEGRLVLAAQSKLRGTAKTWSDTQTVVHRSWADFAAQFLLNFPAHQHEADAHICMVNTSRDTSESITTYYHRMCAIGRRGGVSEASTIKYIQNGLRHAGVQNAIAGMSFKSCLELYHFLSRYEENIPYRNEPARNNILKRSASPLGPYVQAPTRQNADRRHTKCFNCFDYGHISRNCPKPQRFERCAKCNRTGHAERECTITAANQSYRPNRPITNANATTVNNNNPFVAAETDPVHFSTITGTNPRSRTDNRAVIEFNFKKRKNKLILTRKP